MKTHAFLTVISCGDETTDKMAGFSASVSLESKLDVFVDAWFQTKPHN